MEFNFAGPKLKQSTLRVDMDRLLLSSSREAYFLENTLQLSSVFRHSYFTTRHLRFPMNKASYKEPIRQFKVDPVLPKGLHLDRSCKVMNGIHLTGLFFHGVNSLRTKFLVLFELLQQTFQDWTYVFHKTFL